MVGEFKVDMILNIRLIYVIFLLVVIMFFLFIMIVLVFSFVVGKVVMKWLVIC